MVSGLGRVRDPAHSCGAPADVLAKALRAAVSHRIEGTLEKFSSAGVSNKLVTFDDNPAAREHRVGHTGYLDALEHRIVDPHVVGGGADDVFARRMKNYEVGSLPTAMVPLRG